MRQTSRQKLELRLGNVFAVGNDFVTAKMNCSIAVARIKIDYQWP